MADFDIYGDSSDFLLTNDDILPSVAAPTIQVEPKKPASNIKTQDNKTNDSLSSSGIGGGGLNKTATPTTTTTTTTSTTGIQQLSSFGNTNNLSSSGMDSAQQNMAYMNSQQFQLMRALILENLTWWTTDQDLYISCIDAGISKDSVSTTDISFAENRSNGKSKGMAQIVFQSNGDAIVAKSFFDKIELHSVKPVTRISYFDVTKPNAFASGNVGPPALPLMDQHQQQPQLMSGGMNGPMMGNMMMRNMMGNNMGIPNNMGLSPMGNGGMGMGMGPPPGMMMNRPPPSMYGGGGPGFLNRPPPMGRATNLPPPPSLPNMPKPHTFQKPVDDPLAPPGVNDTRTSSAAPPSLPPTGSAPPPPSALPDFTERRPSSSAGGGPGSAASHSPPSSHQDLRHDVRDSQPYYNHNSNQPPYGGGRDWYPGGGRGRGGWGRGRGGYNNDPPPPRHYDEGPTYEKGNYRNGPPHPSLQYGGGGPRGGNYPPYQNERDFYDRPPHSRDHDRDYHRQDYYHPPGHGSSIGRGGGSQNATSRPIVEVVERRKDSVASASTAATATGISIVGKASSVSGAPVEAKNDVGGGEGGDADSSSRFKKRKHRRRRHRSRSDSSDESEDSDGDEQRKEQRRSHRNRNEIDDNDEGEKKRKRSSHKSSSKKKSSSSRKHRHCSDSEGGSGDEK
ncbi:UNVERIFIED_CONTAM: Cleavage and polyadenylation specificity factor subunit 6 [Siphonaria sp. JEL0065]|nr:Cleavage and polyadenylation specificity factor subunit 6 [Siphonaria sp. JEL0065]